ncbi:hypothetical protein D3C73_660240 [compost metagenome]
MTRVKICPNDFTNRFTQAKQCCWSMNRKAPMKLQTNFHIAISGIFSPLGPIWNDFILPLPSKYFLVIIRPRGDRPVRIFRILMITRAPGKRIYNWNFQKLSKLNRLHISIMELFCNHFLRMKRITMTA